MPNNGWLPLVVGPRKSPCVLYLAIHEENIYEKYSHKCALCTIHVYTQGKSNLYRYIQHYLKASVERDARRNYTFTSHGKVPLILTKIFGKLFRH